VADGESNLALFMYQPESRESLGGQKLIRKADFHLGQKVNTFFRIRCRINDPANNKKHFSGADKRHVTMYGKSKYMYNEYYNYNNIYELDNNNIIIII
jgi:cleavage and polyadenylation specificity factor subunit 1